MMSEECILSFQKGTIGFFPPKDFDHGRIPSQLVLDKRTLTYRGSAYDYSKVVTNLLQNKISFSDKARDYAFLDLSLDQPIVPRTHQQLGLDHWLQAQKRGVVSLPTGAGKTILAVLAIVQTNRPTLVMVPTIDLMLQWQKTLEEFLAVKIGLLGGGSRDIEAITVSTYDSAKIHIPRIGNKFGLLVFDECHHLPAEGYREIAISSIAPFRLGLSATLERADGGEAHLNELIGPTVYTAEIQEMTDTVLAPYDVVSIEIPLTEEERDFYDKNRTIYTNFLKSQRIHMGNPRGWQRFIQLSARSAEGRRAMQAYRNQKRTAQGTEGKIHALWDLLTKHRNDLKIIFTDNNELAYKIGEKYLLPVITHQTKAKERKFFLESFSTGEITTLVTSKVLNEGVDVPEASVAIVVSGSGTVREHVQRLGRVLRHRPGKRAILYELISKETSEKYVNQRRRKHSAYQRTY